MKKIPVWPTLATVGNLICGFSAMAAAAAGAREAASGANQASAALFERSAWLIIAAMLFDAADGRLARMKRCATEFGGQLDSLADIVSFGAAPAFLAYYFVHTHIPSYSAKFAWTASGIYVICAALRLARFNVENVAHSSSHNSFKGLPTPGAAGLIATSVIFLDSLRLYIPHVIIGLVPVVAICAAVLMVTKIHYPHIVSQLDVGGRPFAFLVLVIFLGMLVAAAPHIGLFIVFALYAASGPIGLTIDQVLERLAAASDSDDSLF